MRLDVGQQPLHRDERDHGRHHEADGELGQRLAGELAIGFGVSAVVAFVAVKWLLTWIQTHRFTPFAWYRVGFGAALLLLL